MTVTLELVHVLLLVLFAAVAGACILLLAALGIAAGFGTVLGRAFDRAEMSSLLNSGPSDAAREADIERNFRLEGGYGPPGDAHGTVTLPAPRQDDARATCGPCARVRAQLKKIYARFK